MRSVCLLILLGTATSVRADMFDDLTNTDLQKIVMTDAVMPMPAVSANQLSGGTGLVPQSSAAILILRTKEGRFTKLQVQAGLQNVGGVKHPALFIEKYATFKDGEERATVAKGGAVQLYAGLQFNADLGQVATNVVGGDLEMIPAEVMSKLTVKPVAPAKLYLLKKKPLIDTVKKTQIDFVEPFEPRYFNGRFKLYDDGRRSGELTLRVDDATGTITGSFFSDKEGSKYEVSGKVGAVRHQLNFSIKFPQSVCEYSGHMFTGDGKAIAGTSRLRDRDTAFYAVRAEGSP